MRDYIFITPNTSIEKLEQIKNMKLMEYKKCKHQLVYSEIKYDECDMRTLRFCACIKCGLDESVKIHEGYKYFLIDKVMRDYLGWNDIQGKTSEYICDIELAHAIYTKIKEAHPNIDDETATKYFEIALDNIRNNKVSEERKENRAKRLCLTPGFNRWNKEDISELYH